MEEQSLYGFIRESMEKNNLKFTKSLGQNFLTDRGVLLDIVEADNLTSEDYVLEIGPGVGVLTRELAKCAKKVVAVEIDRHIIGALKSNISQFENVEVLNEDILKINIDELKKEHFDGNNFKVVANLPYYITTPIIMGLLEQKCGVVSMVVMVQKEVAERMVAKVGKAYGSLSVAVQYYGNVKIERVVKSGCFVPAPKVDSAVVSINIYEKPQIELKSEKVFFEIIKAAFNQRRKTLLNSLSGSPFFQADKSKISEVLGQCGIDTNIRAERLTIQDFANISNSI